MKRTIRIIFSLALVVTIICTILLSSLLMTVYAATENSVTKIVNVKPDYKFNIPSEAPNLRIEDEQKDLHPERETFSLKLHNAEWLQDKDFPGGTFESAMLSCCQSISPAELEISRVSDSTVDVTVQNAVYKKDDLVLRIPMLTKVLNAGEAKVEIRPMDGGTTAGTYTFAVGVKRTAYITVSDVKEFSSDEVLAFNRIEIAEGFSKLLPLKSGQIYLKLPQGFKWVKSGTIRTSAGLAGVSGVASIDGENLKIEMDYSGAKNRNTPGKIILEGTAIQAMPNAASGDVKIEIIGDHITNWNIKLATYKESSDDDRKTQNIFDEKWVDEKLKNHKELEIFINGKKDAETKIALSALKRMADINKFLQVKKGNIALKVSGKIFSQNEFQKPAEKSFWKLGINNLEESCKDDILSKALSDKKIGLSSIDIDIFELYSTVTMQDDKIITPNFNEPALVTFNLSEKNISKEDAKKLTAVQYKKDAKDDITPVKLGGRYNADNKTFTFYTDQPGLYGVLKAEHLKNINLTVDSEYANINGTSYTLDVSPKIINNRTMIPLRSISEFLGAEVQWSEKTREVSLKLNNKEWSFSIDQEIPGMAVTPVIANDRTLVPVRYISENLGAYVLWFPSNRTIQIIK